MGSECAVGVVQGSSGTCETSVRESWADALSRAQRESSPRSQASQSQGSRTSRVARKCDVVRGERAEATRKGGAPRTREQPGVKGGKRRWCDGAAPRSRTASTCSFDINPHHPHQPLPPSPLQPPPIESATMLSRAVLRRSTQALRTPASRRWASQTHFEGAADNAFNRERAAVKQHAAETSGAYPPYLLFTFCRRVEFVGEEGAREGWRGRIRF